MTTVALLGVPAREALSPDVFSQALKVEQAATSAPRPVWLGFSAWTSYL